MEKIKLDFAKIEKITNTIVSCSNTLTEENSKLQSDFKELNKEFDDAYYTEYEGKFEEGNRVIERMKEATNDILLAIITYASKMQESK